MTATPAFDVNASFPADPKHRVAVEALVAQAAECAGCAPAVARDLADEAGAAFVAGTGAVSPDTDVNVRVDHDKDTINVAVSSDHTVRMARPVPAN